MTSVRPLSGRVIIVTGGGRGIGAATAQAIAEDGGLPVITDLDEQPALQRAAEIEAGYGVAAEGRQLDVTDESAVTTLVQKTVERHGRLDGLVNNAAILVMRHSLEDSTESWRRQFEVNATATYSCSIIAARAMIATGAPGSIVNIASEEGKVGNAFSTAYNASKAAVINLTRGLALELHPYNINVNAVCPGSVESPMLRDVADFYLEAAKNPDYRRLLPGMPLDGSNPATAEDVLESFHPWQLGRLIQPLEVGRIVSFLLSDRAAIIRGQSINVDGGTTPY